MAAQLRLTQYFHCCYFTSFSIFVRFRYFGAKSKRAAFFLTRQFDRIFLAPINDMDITHRRHIKKVISRHNFKFFGRNAGPHADAE